MKPTPLMADEIRAVAREVRRQSQNKRERSRLRVSPEWNVVRAQLDAATNGHCEACGFAPIDSAILHLHHIQPVAHDGDDSMDNAALICPNCHATAHFRYRVDQCVPLGRAEFFAYMATPGAIGVVKLHRRRPTRGTRDLLAAIRKGA